LTPEPGSRQSRCAPAEHQPSLRSHEPPAQPHLTRPRISTSPSGRSARIAAVAADGPAGDKAGATWLVRPANTPARTLGRRSRPPFGGAGLCLRRQGKLPGLLAPDQVAADPHDCLPPLGPENRHDDRGPRVRVESGDDRPLEFQRVHQRDRQARAGHLPRVDHLLRFGRPSGRPAALWARHPLRHESDSQRRLLTESSADSRSYRRSHSTSQGLPPRRSISRSELKP
jgi:hypothetical protein